MGTVFALPSCAIIGAFEYDGTSDLAWAAVRTHAEIRAGWRTDKNRRVCKCAARIDQPVRLFTDYAQGFGWLSIVCMACMTITGPCDDEHGDVDPAIVIACARNLAAFHEVKP